MYILIEEWPNGDTASYKELETIEEVKKYLGDDYPHAHYIYVFYDDGESYERLYDSRWGKVEINKLDT